MIYRKLRIAWSVACVLGCVVLSVFWYRSTTWQDDFHWMLPNDRLVYVSSVSNRVWFAWIDRTGIAIVPSERGIGISSVLLADPSSTAYEQWNGWPIRFTPGLRWMRSQVSLRVAVPHPLLIAVGAAVATLPWFRWKWRFSLRTLLIATTFVAVVLGLAAMMLRGR
jgi:hypothetical protein